MRTYATIPRWGFRANEHFRPVAGVRPYGDVFVFRLKKSGSAKSGSAKCGRMEYDFVKSYLHLRGQCKTVLVGGVRVMGVNGDMYRLGVIEVLMRTALDMANRISSNSPRMGRLLLVCTLVSVIGFNCALLKNPG